MPVIRTVAGPATVEIDKIKGSRFVADVAPAASEAAAAAVVEAIRLREPAASHHCWAYVLSSGRARSSDDGEPGGTAGAPIQRHVEGSGLVDLVVVVTRWFGGTKLGTGGLIRAYGAAAAAVLDAVGVVERPVVSGFALRHDYDLTGVVEGVLAAFDAETEEARYTAAVDLRVAVDADRAADFAAAVVEATAGRVSPQPTRAV